MATKEDIKEKLNVIGLDLDNLPDFIENPKPINFNSSRLNNDKELKVYKFVQIREIEIYVTPTHRDDSIKDKYNNAISLCDFIRQSEDDSEKSAELMRMFSRVSELNLKRLENEQRKMLAKSPFLVRYNKCQLWQVYYSQDTDRYFMLVSLKEDTFDELFYLIKKRIELEALNKDEQIYVPISYVNYSEEYLTNKQINDIENYLWVFTKSWPITYEVYDEQNRMSLQMVGETPVYDKLKSMYKIVLKSEEQADEFYKLIKALFILQTELDNRYNFNVQVNSDDGLDFYYEGKQIVYSDLPEFIKEKYTATETDIKQFNQQAFALEDELKMLKLDVKKKESEYFLKQKEISTYLECKKSFFGKVKYFFSKKKNKSENADEEVIPKEEEKKEPKPIQGYSDDKKFHTIDDLVTMQALYEKSERYVKDLIQDIKALTLKLVNLKKKIENATIYIKEIDEHKKSLFDFWKFANKDEVLQLENGDESIQDDVVKIKKKFDFDYDFEDLGIDRDKLQRTKFSKQEMDNVFIASTNVLPIINMFKAGDMDKDAIEELLRSLKSEYFTTNSSIKTDFDIFGSMKEDSTQVKYLNNKSHRENEKDKFNILNVNKKIDIFDFTEQLQSILSSIKETMCKITSSFDMPIYKVVPINEKLHKTDYSVWDINPERELRGYDNKFESAVKLIKLNFKEDFPLVYFTNSIYYDNINGTLPEGMDVSSKVLIDADKFEYELAQKSKVNTNRYFNMPDGLYPRMITIYIEEYNLKIKDKTQDNEETQDK